MKIAAAQISPIYLNKDQTVKKACSAILEAGQAGAKLVVFPEAFVAGYPDWIWLIRNSKSVDLNALYIKLLLNAVTIPDDSTTQICKAAQEAGINVVIGLNEVNSENSRASLYNTLLFVNEHGEILGKHRKLVPTGGERLIWARGDGSSLQTYETTAGIIGGLVCWENYMPLSRMALYEKGVQILAAPTWDKSPGWLTSMMHNAKEGGMFLISACMPLRLNDIPDDLTFKLLYPEGKTWINTGNSCIFGPTGKILAGPLEGEEGILFADIDLLDIIAAKRMFDVAGHYARPDVFQFRVRDLPE